MIQSKTANQAKEYFSESLLKSDYYVDDQELNGSFHGKVAKRLGIEGLVTKDVFHALCENIHPKTGNSLTPRKVDNRTVGYDINFHCPKSVSVLHALSNDSHLLDAFHQSVIETMGDIESDAKTRVRKNGKDENRPSDGLLYADFIHQTARPVKEDKPDPHLHCHCFVFNVTWDEVEQKFKAGQFRDIKRDMPYYEAMFHKRLSDNLMNLGYKIKPTKTAFEIEAVPQNIIDLFSKRTNEIGQVAKEQNITDAKKLDALGGKTRAKKEKGLTMPQLKMFWIAQIKAMGFDPALSKTILRNIKPIKGVLKKAKQVIDFSLLHHFERLSVVQDRKLLQTAIRHSMGSPSLGINAIQTNLLKNKNVIHSVETDAIFSTTREVIEEERQIVNLIQAGKKTLTPLYSHAPRINLDGDQKEAVQHILKTNDPVSIIMGRAGTGKTTLMKEAISKINDAGKSVMVVAPTAQASRGVLRDEGFENAETVAKLLSSPDLQQDLTNQVLWVDEAGLMGTKDMLALLTLAKNQNAQLILSGDINQHSSVARGDALRLLKEVAGVEALSVNKVYRQKNEVYRKAVEALSIGDAETGYANLNKMGAIIETDQDDLNETLVEDYIEGVKRKKSLLVVSPTHKQCLVVTNSLRTALKENGMIDRKDHLVKRYVNLNLTEAEKQDAKSFKQDDIIRFNQNADNIKRGSIWAVASVGKSNVSIIDKDNNEVQLPLMQSRKFDVHKEDMMPVTKGDRICITRNGFDVNRKRLNNGQELIVQRFHKNGSIVVKTQSGRAKYILPNDYAHINHGYCMTSHASQGKTTDRVLVSQPSSTFPASDLKQFYVSVSRGRESVTVYTDDKEGLMHQITSARKRRSALELLCWKDNAKDIADENIISNTQSVISHHLTNKLIL